MTLLIIKYIIPYRGHCKTMVRLIYLYPEVDVVDFDSLWSLIQGIFALLDFTLKLCQEREREHFYNLQETFEH